MPVQWHLPHLNDHNNHNFIVFLFLPPLPFSPHRQLHHSLFSPPPTFSTIDTASLPARLHILYPDLVSTSTSTPDVPLHRLRLRIPSLDLTSDSTFPSFINLAVSSYIHSNPLSPSRDWTLGFCQRCVPVRFLWFSPRFLRLQSIRL